MVVELERQAQQVQVEHKHLKQVELVELVYHLQSLARQFTELVVVVELHKELVDSVLVEMVVVVEECPTQIPQQLQMELPILVAVVVVLPLQVELVMLEMVVQE